MRKDGKMPEEIENIKKALVYLANELDAVADDPKLKNYATNMVKRILKIKE